MKKSLFTIILASVCVTAFLLEDYEYTWRIQVAASKSPIAKNAKIYTALWDVEGVKGEDGYYRYFVGKYETFYQAKEDLTKVQEAGYKSAYIICIHKGKRMSVDDAIMEIYGEE